MTSRYKTTAILIICGTIFSSLLGCNLFDLTPPSEVVRPRIAGIRAVPAEIGLGESTTLDALFVQPAGDDSEWGALWFSCVEAGGAAGCLGGSVPFGGGDDLFGGDDDDSAAPPPADPRDFQFAAGASFTYTAHGTVIEEAWAALSPEDQVEGLVVLVSVNYVPRSHERLQELLLTIIFGGQSEDPEVAAAEAEAAAAELTGLFENGINAARRIVVSDKSGDEPDDIECPAQELRPNENPQLEGLLLHVAEDGKDQGLPLGQVTFVAPEDILVLRPVLQEGAIEDYLYITTDGETQCRSESPYFAWLTNAGQMERDYSFLADEGDLDEVSGRLKINRLTLPSAELLPPQSDLWLVARDRRGGIDWKRFDLVREQQAQ